MKNVTNDDTIIKKANKIINTWLLKSSTNRNKIDPIDVTDTLSNSEKKETTEISEQK